MPDFQYVYILFSECGEHHYVGAQQTYSNA